MQEQWRDIPGYEDRKRIMVNGYVAMKQRNLVISAWFFVEKALNTTPEYINLYCWLLSARVQPDTW